VNKQLSAKYETLVNDAPRLIKGLPWGKDFEVDLFKKPDFTALEVLSFATGGTSNRRSPHIQLRVIITLKEFLLASM
jgi:dipeptidyl-peptidase-3